MYKGGLDRFKKAQSLEPFAVTLNSATKTSSNPPAEALASKNSLPTQNRLQQQAVSKPAAPEAVPPPPASHTTQIGGGQSSWQPPDWAIEPRPEFIISRHIFGRQFPTCDFVLDHQSVSRQHAAVVPHKNGSIYVIDLGSVHGTFVASERLTKDNPVELEVGQSLRFAASTRSYILRKNAAALFPKPAISTELNLPSPPDPNDEDGVVAYNTILNRYGISKSDLSSNSKSTSSGTDDNRMQGRPAKRSKRLSVAFKDQVGGELVEVVGISDGADVETEPGPIGVKEGSLVGKYESLIQITVIPKGKEQVPPPTENVSPKGVTEKLQQVLNKVKSNPKSGIYDGLYGDSLSGKAASSWAYKGAEEKPVSEKPVVITADETESDDLFGDS
uniref:FHA domain-containing protein n=1 Tax=Ananas comosus var. bracteatus TaxID=296719 RepID=A0A6V7Q8P9_ANACO|nr:unnamed protein product [Ananas comosus var. bracteatus]